LADYPDNWWVTNGKCRLLEIPDEYIIDFLSRIPRARKDYEIIVPLLPAANQAALATLIADNPRAAAGLIVDDGAAADAEQKKWNTAGVRTRMPGGKKVV
jgi:hypothetical protein